MLVCARLCDKDLREAPDGQDQAAWPTVQTKSLQSFCGAGAGWWLERPRGPWEGPPTRWPWRAEESSQGRLMLLIQLRERKKISRS